MKYLVIDLEATCWERGSRRDRMEIIEIGAVMLSPTGISESEFARFVRPIDEPILSAFCVQLTTIRQEDVDHADPFNKVLPELLAWAGREPYYLCSWGGYDQAQLRLDCERHGLSFPLEFEQHINLKSAFAARKSIKPCGMKTALDLLGIPMVGQHHRGIDDAHNIACITHFLLPDLPK